MGPDSGTSTSVVRRRLWYAIGVMFLGWLSSAAWLSIALIALWPAVIVMGIYRWRLAPWIQTRKWVMRGGWVMATAPITRLAVVFLVPPMVGGPISLNGSVGQFVIGIIMLDAIPGIVVIAGPLLFVRKSPFDLDRWAFWATMALGPPLVLLGISFTRGNDFGSWLFVMVSPIMGFVVIAPWIVMVRRTMRDSVLSVAPPAADDEVDFWVSLRSA